MITITILNNLFEKNWTKFINPSFFKNYIVLKGEKIIILSIFNKIP